MPLFSGMTANNRAVAEANTFLSAFKLARSEAIKRSTRVSVCAVADPNATTVTCSSSSSDWTKGLMVFTDDTGTAGVLDGTTDVGVRVFAIPATGSTSDSSGSFVRFEPQGEADLTSLTANTACPTSGTCIELKRDDTRGNKTRCLYVMQSGQIRLERGACS
jgi:type IV fimbrial biogenesis protein FimT